MPRRSSPTSSPGSARACTWRSPRRSRPIRAWRAEPAGNAAAELAFHWRACHRLDEALTASVEAGLQAESSYAFAEANRQFENALELWERVDEAERRAGMDHPAMLLRAAQNASLNGQAHRAVALARSAVDEADPAADPTRAGLARERLGEFLWLAGDSEGAIEVLREAVDLLPSEPPGVERARVLAAEARILVLHGRPEESRARCEEAIAIARSLGARAEEGHALNTLGLGLLLVGERTGAIARLSESIRIAEDCSPEDLWRAYANLSEALEQDGRVEEAVELGLEGAELVRPLGQRHWGAYILGQVASQLVRLGRLDEAERLTATGLETRIEGIDTAILKSVASEISLLRGNLEAAETELERAVRAAGPTTDWAIRAMLADRQRWWPCSAAIPDRAAALVDEAIASMDDGEYLFYTARMYALAVRAHADSAERARALGDAANGGGGGTVGHRDRRASRATSRSGAVAGFTAARVGGSRGAGRRRARAPQGRAGPRRLERRRRPMGRARLQPRARLRPLATGRGRARRRRRKGRSVRAAARGRPADRRVRSLAARFRDPGACPAGEDRAGRSRRGAGGRDARSASDRFGLTRRELDVLALVADGRTNREIGETLFISTKTASTHVSHILSKLEVRSRIEAATAAHRLGLVPEESGD